MVSSTVIAADRSMLAVNMYKLLMNPFGITVINAPTMEEMRRELKKAKNVDLILISSNILAGKFERVFSLMKEEEVYSKIAKIFLFRESDMEKGWCEQLMTLPRTEVVEKPFHPDEFITHIKRLMAIED